MSSFTSSFASSSLKQFNGIVPALSTVDFDSTIISAFKGVKYTISLFSDAEDKYRTFEMLARRKSGNALVQTIYAKIGDAINVKFTIVEDSGNVVLRVENNENFDISLRGFKLLLS